MNLLPDEFSKYISEEFVAAKIKELARKKVISQTMALHYELMLIDREYYNDKLIKRDLNLSVGTKFNKSVSAAERFSSLIPLPSLFSVDLFDFQSPLHIAIDIYILSELFLESGSIDVVFKNVSNITGYFDRYRESISKHQSQITRQDYWYNPTTLLSELKLIGHKSLCMDNFRISKTVSDLMRITAISDKVPAKMVIPTRAMTLIELPETCGLNIFNASTGWHELESITMFKDDHQANSGATARYSPDMLKAAGITEKTPFTRICFYLNGKPHDGATYFDDATMFINILIKDYERPLVDAISNTLLNECNIDPIMLEHMLGENMSIKQDGYDADSRIENTLQIIRYATSIMLFVNSNYARKEFIQTKQESVKMPSVDKVNHKKLAIKVQKESAVPAFTRLHFQSSASDQTSVTNYLKDTDSEKRRVSPHWRIPHWRSQHYGTENKLIKLVFIPPVFVGAKKLNEPIPGRKHTI